MYPLLKSHEDQPIQWGRWYIYVDEEICLLNKHQWVNTSQWNKWNINIDNFTIFCRQTHETGNNPGLTSFLEYILWDLIFQLKSSGWVLLFINLFKIVPHILSDVVWTKMQNELRLNESKDPAHDLCILDFPFVGRFLILFWVCGVTIRHRLSIWCGFRIRSIDMTLHLFTFKVNFKLKSPWCVVCSIKFNQEISLSSIEKKSDATIELTRVKKQKHLERWAGLKAKWIGRSLVVWIYALICFIECLVGRSKQENRVPHDVHKQEKKKLKSSAQRCWKSSLRGSCDTGKQLRALRARRNRRWPASCTKKIARCSAAKASRKMLCLSQWRRARGNRSSDSRQGCSASRRMEKLHKETATRASRTAERQWSSAYDEPDASIGEPDTSLPFSLSFLMKWTRFGLGFVFLVGIWIRVEDLDVGFGNRD